MHAEGQRGGCGASQCKPLQGVAMRKYLHPYRVPVTECQRVSECVGAGPASGRCQRWSTFVLRAAAVIDCVA